MEPLTALALAGNVLQFIDFGCKLFSQGCELYKSTDGRLAVDDEIRLIAADVQDFVAKIKSQGVISGCWESNTLEASSFLERNRSDANFGKICDEAVKIAEAILSKLENRKLNKDRNRKAQSFARVWSQLWSQGELDALFERLSRLKEAINSDVLAAILQKINELSADGGRALAQSQASHREVRSMLRSVLDSSRTINREVVAAVAQLTSRMEMLLDEKIDHNRTAIMEELNKGLSMFSLHSQSRQEDAFTLAQWDEKQLWRLVNNSILRHLTYEMLPKRYESVVEAHPKTFEWAFQDLEGISLSSWLETQDGLFWISGKPGSGKSTLMKHILDNQRTRISLEKWARRGATSNVPLTIASFFFWNSGAPEQRSQIGMLRSLLFQVLEQRPELIPVAFPSLWLKQYGKYLSNGPDVAWSEKWSLGTLMTAFKRLAFQQELDCNIFLLIDGLDEFDGDHEVLAELLNEISENESRDSRSFVKLCVSSRLYVVFQENFQGRPTLRLQDLTIHDITVFVSDRFLGNGAFQKLAIREPKASSDLIKAVVSKADGVFLWVFIVVKDLLRGIRNRDSIIDLWRRLDALPRELEPLYLRILSEIDTAYLAWASKTFQLIRAARHCIAIQVYFKFEGLLSIVELYYALNDSLDILTVQEMKEVELDSVCREMDYHITARCACLLEVSDASMPCDGQIQYLHRTAKDFLEEPSRWAMILDHAGSDAFDPWWSMLRSKSLLAHRIVAKLPDRVESRLEILGVEMLVCCMKVDRQSAFHKSRMSWLNDAENLLERFDASFTIPAAIVPYYDDAMIDTFPQKIRSPLLACALALNFSEYVALKLMEFRAQNPEAGKRAATFMLRHLDDQGDFDIDMATMLLKQGANIDAPTRADSNVTVWEMFLSKQAQHDMSDRQTGVDQRLQQFMSTAVASRANPDISVGVRVVSPAGKVPPETRLKYPAETALQQKDVHTSVEPCTRSSTHVESEEVQSDRISVEITQQPQAVTRKSKRRHWWKRIL